MPATTTSNPTTCRGRRTMAARNTTPIWRIRSSRWSCAAAEASASACHHDAFSYPLPPACVSSSEQSPVLKHSSSLSSSSSDCQENWNPPGNPRARPPLPLAKWKPPPPGNPPPPNPPPPPPKPPCWPIMLKRISGSMPMPPPPPPPNMSDMSRSSPASYRARFLYFC